MAELTLEELIFERSQEIQDLFNCSQEEALRAARREIKNLRNARRPLEDRR